MINGREKFEYKKEKLILFELFDHLCTFNFNNKLCLIESDFVLRSKIENRKIDLCISLIMYFSL